MEHFEIIGQWGDHAMHRHKANGLVVHVVDRPEAMPSSVALNVLYHVGSDREGLGVTGATHFLEHMAFEGTAKFCGKNGMWYLERKGATMNATTSNSRTHYYALLPIDALDDATTREADRMANLRVSQDRVDSQSSVVHNELERGENNPASLLWNRMLNVAFVAHPCRVSTIGWSDDVNHVDADKLQAFHDRFYHPRNAEVMVVGNLGGVREGAARGAEACLAKIHRDFGEIPAGPEPPEAYTDEPAQLGPRRFEMATASTTTHLAVGYKTPNGVHPDALGLEMVGTWWQDARLGPLRALVDERIVDDSISVVSQRLKFPYLLGVMVRVLEPASAEDRLHEALRTLPTAADLERLKRRMLADWSEARESNMDVMLDLNEAAAMGDPTDAHTRDARVRDLTLERLHGLIRTYVDPMRRTVGLLRPRASDDAPALGPAALAAEAPLPSTPTGARKDAGARRAPATFTWASRVGETRMRTADRTTKVVGRDMTLPTSALTRVRISLVGCGRAHALNPMLPTVLCALMRRGAVVDGTAWDRGMVDAFLGDAQTSVGFAAGALDLEASLRVHGKVAEPLRLLRAMVASPIVTPEGLDAVKQELRANMDARRASVDQSADRAFLQRLFPATHPLHAISLEEETTYLDALEAEHLDEFVRTTVAGAPWRVSVLDGTGEHAEVFEALAALDGVVDPPRLGSSAFVAEPSTLRVEVPGAASTTVVAGVAVEADEPRRALLRVALGALGNGFLGRLMLVLRDRMGLTYGAYARLVESDPSLPCVVRITATFAPRNTDRGIDELRRVVREFHERGITAEELAAQKDFVLGSERVVLDDHDAIVARMHAAMGHGLSLRDMDARADAIRKLTLDEVNAGIRALPLDRLVLVSAGAASL